MIGATNGRTYKGVRQNGYGVFDFKKDSAATRTKTVGSLTYFHYYRIHTGLFLFLLANR